MTTATTQTECKLTTIDNPFDPFNDFDNWFLFDIEKNYNSCSLLDRIADIKDDMTDVEKDIEIERAIDQIIKYDITGMYSKATRTVPVTE